MASEEEVAASRRLLEDVTKTPTKTGDPDYIYSEASLLDWLKLFGGAIKEADYGPKLIAAGFDCIANLVGTVEHYVAVGMPIGHAVRLQGAASKIHSYLITTGTPSPTTPASKDAPVTVGVSRGEALRAAGAPPPFPTCSSGSFPGRVAFSTYITRLHSWTARWSTDLSTTLTVLKKDYSTRVKTLIKSLTDAGDDIVLGGHIIATLPDHLLLFIDDETSGLRILRDLARPVMKKTSKSTIATRDAFTKPSPFSSEANLLIEITQWEGLRAELKEIGEEQSELSCMDSLLTKVKGIKKLKDIIDVKVHSSDTTISSSSIISYLKKVGEDYVAERDSTVKAAAIAALVADQRDCHGWCLKRWTCSSPCPRGFQHRPELESTDPPEILARLKLRQCTAGPGGSECRLPASECYFKHAGKVPEVHKDPRPINSKTGTDNSNPNPAVLPASGSDDSKSGFRISRACGEGTKGKEKSLLTSSKGRGKKKKKKPKQQQKQSAAAVQQQSAAVQQQSAAVQQQSAAVLQQQDSQQMVGDNNKYICGDNDKVIDNNNIIIPQQQQQQQTAAAVQQQSAALQQQRAAVSQQQDSQHIVEGSYEYICGELYTVINNKLTVPQQQQQQSQQQRQQCSSSQQHSTAVSPSSSGKGDFESLSPPSGGAPQGL